MKIKVFFKLMNHIFWIRQRNLEAWFVNIRVGYVCNIYLTFFINWGKINLLCVFTVAFICGCITTGFQSRNKHFQHKRKEALVNIHIFQKLFYTEEVIHHCENIFKGGIRCEIQNGLKAESSKQIIIDKRILYKAFSLQNYFISPIY